eukprot:CAMPEP_0180656100 /NCGR_PEP_ID=MMETSP1037_2-20121125/55659_1 /TAXON_ID=632150 /ORGANISM="Azadinium spinosum, Strain 3D9" /LENGTH=107 /DNA_ID=CAMNT_0022682635 /DNA_START=63 /DNA_END=382 /DNA_ORIENTATION=-
MSSTLCPSSHLAGALATAGYICRLVARRWAGKGLRRLLADWVGNRQVPWSLARALATMLAGAGAETRQSSLNKSACLLKKSSNVFVIVFRALYQSSLGESTADGSPG